MNILMWIMFFGSLNCAEILQKKSPSMSLQSSVCPLCMNANESLLHLFLLCPFSLVCWNSFFSIFAIAWVFDTTLNSSVLQLLKGPPLPYKPQLIWINLLNALLAELWFEHNHRIFQDKERSSQENFNSVQCVGEVESPTLEKPRGLILHIR